MTYKSFLVTAAFMLTGSHATGTDIATPLASFLDWKNNADLKERKEIRVLALDHRNGGWSLYDCTPEKCTENKTLHVDAGGRPAINMKTSRHKVVVYNTNVLVYAIQPPTAVDADIEELKSLQEIVGSLGTGLQTLMSVSGTQYGGPFSVVRPTLVRSDLEVLTELMKGWRAAYVVQQARIKEVSDEIVESQRRNDLDRASLVAAIQSLEIGNEFKYPTLKSREHPLDFRALIDARGQAKELKCLGQLSALRALVKLKRNAPYPEGDRVDMSIEATRLYAELGNLSGSCAGDELEKIKAVAGVPAAVSLDKKWDTPEPWVDFERVLANYILVGKAGAALLKSADELIGKSDAMTAGAARIDATVRLIDASKRSDGYFPNFMEVHELWSPPEWYRERTVTFTVSATAPLQEPIAKFHSTPFTGSYLLRNSRITFDVSFGLLFPFNDGPEDYQWGAVTVPGTTKKGIGIVNHADRRAAPTAILTLQLDQLRHLEASPGLDLGVGADPDRLFLSLGVSFQFASFLRVGFAHAWHRVKALEPPQTALVFDADNKALAGSITEVASKDDIRTRNKLEQGTQLYLVVSLRGLNPFKK
jgi:hypothetical protein